MFLNHEFLNSPLSLSANEGLMKRKEIRILTLFILKLKEVCSALASSQNPVHQKTFDDFLSGLVPCSRLTKSLFWVV